MYVPRRHSRRLLLPPGWVALGFLLLLGCQALLVHRRQMQLYSVMQLTMPSVKRDTSQTGKDATIPHMSVKELDRARPWRTIDFTGKPIHDFISAASLDMALQTMNADTSRAGGVRIRFHESATYGNLVEGLDIINLNDQQKYFLDIRHQCIALYSITDAHSRNLAGRQFSYGGCFKYLGEGDSFILAEPTISQLLMRRAASLSQHAWRPSVVLFAVISTLSVSRLTRPRPAAH